MSFTTTIRCLLVFCIVLANTTLSHAQSQDPSFTTVLMQTTAGDLVIELDSERAPQTVENFLEYVDAGFYSNTVFHRVIEGFMIQGGGFDEIYRRKATRQPVSNEAYNGLRNDRYTIAMARTNDAHSATSQFFINSNKNSNLDHVDTTRSGWGYTVFGKVVLGQQVVDAISQVKTGAAGPFRQDVPIDPIVILSVERASPELSTDNPIVTDGDNENHTDDNKLEGT